MALLPQSKKGLRYSPNPEAMTAFSPPAPTPPAQCRNLPPKGNTAYKPAMRLGTRLIKFWPTCRVDSALCRPLSSCWPSFQPWCGHDPALHHPLPVAVLGRLRACHGYLSRTPCKAPHAGNHSPGPALCRPGSGDGCAGKRHHRQRRFLGAPARVAGDATFSAAHPAWPLAWTNCKLGLRSFARCV